MDNKTYAKFVLILLNYSTSLCVYCEHYILITMNANTQNRIAN